MILLGFVLGALVVLEVWLLFSWTTRKKIKLGFFSWLGIVLTSSLALFTIAWFISSLQENESRAAFMGLALFGGVTFAAWGITRIMIARNTRKLRNK